MNTIKRDIVEDLKQKDKECVKEIASLRRKWDTLNSIERGFLFGDYGPYKTLLKSSTYRIAKIKRREVNDKLEELYRERTCNLKTAQEIYEHELSKLKAISSKYKPKNKLIRRRPL